MTKMATMLKNAQNLKKSSFQTTGPIASKLGHLGLYSYKVYINHDPMLTLTFLLQGHFQSIRHLNGKS